MNLFRVQVKNDKWSRWECYWDSNDFVVAVGKYNVCKEAQFTIDSRKVFVWNYVRLVSLEADEVLFNFKRPA